MEKKTLPPCPPFFSSNLFVTVTAFLHFCNPSYQTWRNWQRRPIHLLKPRRGLMAIAVYHRSFRHRFVRIYLRFIHLWSISQCSRRCWHIYLTYVLYLASSHPILFLLYVRFKNDSEMQRSCDFAYRCCSAFHCLAVAEQYLQSL